MTQPLTSAERRTLAHKARVVLARRHLHEYATFVKPALVTSRFSRIVCTALDNFLADVEAKKHPIIVFMAPPQHGKSEIVSRLLPSYIFGRFPSWHIGGCSYGMDLARLMNRDVQRIMVSEAYRELFPGTRLNLRKSYRRGVNEAMNSERFEIVGHSGSYNGVGIGGGLTGKPLNIGIIDDPIKNATEAASATIKEKVWEWYKTVFLTRFAEQSGEIIMLTHWCLDDLAGRVQEEYGERATVLSFEAIANEDTDHEEALIPELHSLEQLRGFRSVHTPSDWQALYQQRPLPKSGGTFKYQWFEIVDLAPTDCVAVRGWDLAATDKADAAYTCGVKMSRSVRTGIIYVENVRRFRGTPHVVDSTIVTTAELDGIPCFISIPQDPGQAGKSQVAHFAKMLAKFAVRFSPETGSKELRAAPFSAQCEAGNVKLVRGSWNKDYIDELCTFPKGKFRDQVDASSRAYTHLIERTTSRNSVVSAPVAVQLGR